MSSAAYFELDLAHGDCEISVVAPMFNEADNVLPLIEEIDAALGGVADYEAIFIDDASSDDTAAALIAAQAQFPRLRILRHENNAGQSRALRTGVLAARGRYVATLDGDGQNDPADIPKLLALLKASSGQDRLVLVGGERQKRRDSPAKRFASRIANGVRRRVLRDGAADTGCGLKVFFRDAYLRLPYFDHMHRYLPALFLREGFRIDFAPVSHRPRRHGVSKYNNLSRLVVAFRDMAGVIWLRARFRDPSAVTEIAAAHQAIDTKDTQAEGNFKSASQRI